MDITYTSEWDAKRYERVGKDFDRTELNAMLDRLVSVVCGDGEADS